MNANLSNSVAMDDIVLFNWKDYSVFGMMLGFSALIGIYFGCFGSKQSTPGEYLFGSKSMKVIPIGLSLVASAISGTTLIGVPTEVYTETASYALMMPSLFLASACLYYFFIPVFCNLKITSLYEYLEIRYNRKLRILASYMYMLHAVIFLPPILYIPSASLSQVTGINLHMITTIVTIVCVFYTTIGGLKAVVWTDFFQTAVTLVACVLIVIIGTYNVGGLSYVFNVANEGGKLNIFNMDPNPFQRNTFWSMTIGTLVSWCSGMACSQASFQRFISLPTVKDAQKALLIFAFGTTLLSGISIYGGLLIYAAYLGCDPVEQKIVGKPDQIYSYYVLDKVGYVPILPGIFVAGVFSAALSTLSTILNTVASLIYEDYIKKKGVSDNRAQLIIKLIVVLLGIFAISTVFIVEKLGNILAVAYTLGGVTGAPVFTMFALGIFFPHSNSKGALTGSLTCFFLLSWIGIGAAMNKVSHGSKNIYSNFPNTCPISNHTMENIYLQNNVTQSAQLIEDDVFFLYKLSYMFYKVFGASIGILVGLVVSYFTGPTDLLTLDENLITPPLRRFLPKKPISLKELELKLMNSNNSNHKN